MTSFSAPHPVTTSSVLLKQAAFPEPFLAGLEFNPPVRGPWNIVHMALAIPEMHLLYICARGCLRGVIMTAAEMGALSRIHWIGVADSDLGTGLLEEHTLERATEIMERLRPKPPLVMIYLSCIHKFCQMDYPTLLDTLSARFPQTRFIGCHMMPTMRKSGPTDEERTRANMFEALEPCEKDRSATLIGNDFLLAKDSLLFSLLNKAGITLRELPACRSYKDYMALAKGKAFLTTNPDAIHAATLLAKRLDTPHLSLPLSYRYDEIQGALSRLCDYFDLPLPDFSQEEEKTEKALANARAVLGERPLTLDFTATPRPLSLARLLLSHGFFLTTLWLDAFQAVEKEDFSWLAKHYPNLVIRSVVAPENRFASKRANTEGERPLAIGQKAAYLSDTDYFLSLVAGSGLYDYTGIRTLASRLITAAKEPQDSRLELQKKGFGQPSPLTSASLGSGVEPPLFQGTLFVERMALENV